MPNSFIFLYFVIIFAIFTNNTQGFRLLQASISPFVDMCRQINLSCHIVIINCSFSAAPRRDLLVLHVSFASLVRALSHAFICTQKSGCKDTKNIWNIQVFFENNQIYLIFAMEILVFRTNVRCIFEVRRF